MSATKITRQRFSLSPFSAETMKEIGDQVLASVKARIAKGVDVQGSPAKPLKPTVHIDRNGQPARFIPYAQQKAKRGLQPIRDWKYTGKLIASLQVISASNDRAVIGSNNPVKASILSKNNKISLLFGLSDTDKEALQKAVRVALEQSIKIVSG